MAATGGVTYDGVPSAQGGDIFKDIGFWVSHRVPQRAAILDHITSNGGVVKSREKDADMLIADCARKNVPPDSYSWKFITESVANGIVQLKDRYRIGADPSVPGSARPSRLSRSSGKHYTHYTHEDDVFLAQWVLSHNHLTGNKTYIALEKENPRHPWQSWRNRYKKTMMQLSEDSLSKLANEELPVGDSEESANAQGSSDRVGDPEVTSPRQETPAPVSPTASSPGQQTPPPATRASSPRQQQTPARASRASSHRQQAPDPASSKASSHRQQAAAPASPGAPQLSPAPSVTQARESPPLNWQKRAQPRKQTLLSATPEPAHEDDDDNDSCSEIKDFYVLLHLFWKANGFEQEDECNVGGKVVGLYDVYAMVLEQDLPHVSVNHVDWLTVAEDLGYDPVLDPEVPSELRQCFEAAKLEEFCEAMESYHGNSNQISEPDSPQQSHQEHVDHFLSSPPAKSASRKRSLESESSSARHAAKRRRRLSRDKEIPPTPEHKVGLASRSPVSRSPSTRRNIMATVDLARTAKVPQQLPDDRATSTESEAFETQDSPPANPRVSQARAGSAPSQRLHAGARSASANHSHVTRRYNDARLEPAKEIAPQRRSADATASTVAPHTNATAARRSLPATFGLSANRIAPRPATESSGTHRQAQRRPAADRGDHPRGGLHDDVIAEKVAYYESLGYPNHIVVEGLKRTSMTPCTFAILVMRSLQEGAGVPTHLQGVWTDQDDQALRMVDRANAEPGESRKAKKLLARLTRKHGLERIELRRRFLEAEMKLNAGTADKA